MARDALITSDLSGERESIAGNVSLQYEPNHRSEYTFEAFYSGYRNESFNNMLFSFVDWHGGLGGLVNDRDEFDSLEDTFTLYPGTNVIRNRAIRDGFTFTSGDYSRSKTDSYLVALGGDWDLTDNLNLRSEVVYKKSEYENEFFAMRGVVVHHDHYKNISGTQCIVF